MQNNQEQARYQFIPELDNLPLLNAQFKNQCFSRHVHKGYCIGVIEQGAQRFYRSGGNHIASENCIILVNADQVHDGQTATEDGWKYRAIYPEESMLLQVLDGFNEHQGIPLFDTPVVSDRELASELRGLFNLLSCSDNRLLNQSQYLSTMTKLIIRYAKGRRTLKPVGNEIKACQQVCEYIISHLPDSVTTQELAMLTGLNPQYLIRSFRKVMGLPPHAWQIQQRLQKATDLLKSGYNGTQAGLAVGFSDQSHFNRHFLRMYGTTPGRFRKFWRT